MAEQSRLDKVIALARHRGFVFQAGEIYGGSRSAWDYGPLGTELKENIRRQWWQTFVRGRGDMVGLDSSIILPKRVWEASGHVATFTDPLVECLQCHKRFRADNLIEDFEARKGRTAENGLADVPCPNCGTHIEKNGGCDHMTCQRAAGGCGHEFWFKCGCNYRGAHTCGRGRR